MQNVNLKKVEDKPKEKEKKRKRKTMNDVLNIKVLAQCPKSDCER